MSTLIHDMLKTEMSMRDVYAEVWPEFEEVEEILPFRLCRLKLSLLP